MTSIYADCGTKIAFGKRHSKGATRGARWQSGVKIAICGEFDPGYRRLRFAHVRRKSRSTWFYLWLRSPMVMNLSALDSRMPHYEISATFFNHAAVIHRAFKS